MSTSRLARWWFNKVLGCSRFVHNIPHAWSQFPCNFKRRVLINNIFLRLFAKKRSNETMNQPSQLGLPILYCLYRMNSPFESTCQTCQGDFTLYLQIRCPYSHPPNSKHSQQAPNFFIGPILSHAFDRGRFEEGIANWPSFPWGIQARFPSHRAYGVR